MRIGGKVNLPPNMGVTTLLTAPRVDFIEVGTSFGLENVHIEAPRVCNHAGLMVVTA